jgi:hypothetical protein
MRRPTTLLAFLLVAGGPCVMAPIRGAEYDPAVDAVVLRPGERQLFLDDFLLGDVNAVTRVTHSPRKYEGNPVVRADLPTDGVAIQLRDAPVWDEREQVWKLWYMRFGDDGNGAGGSGFARSKDGLVWEKPMLGLVESRGNRQNNLILVQGDPAAFTQHVILDPEAPPERRYKGHDRTPRPPADRFGGRFYVHPPAGAGHSEPGRIPPELGPGHPPVPAHGQTRRDPSVARSTSR